jgi:adenosylcobinamide-GDP ribazoletransferase
MVAGMDARRGLFADFMLATAVLTRLPVATEPPEQGAIAAACWAFPLVGAGVGAVAAIVFVAAELLGLATPIAAPLAVFAGILLTGAFHEDGLADTADGFGGGRDAAAKLAIMRDSRHGTYGILALIGSVGLRAAAIAVLASPLDAGMALVAAHVVSRAALPPLMRSLQSARPDGLAAAAGTPSRAAALISGVFGIAIALIFLGPGRGATALILTGIAVATMAVLARRQIGGYTGDVLGAFEQIGEIAMLLVAAAK